MLSFIFWLLGVVLTIKAALDIWKLKGDDVKKILFIILIVLSNWIGIVVYYLFKSKFPEWVK